MFRIVADLGNTRLKWGRLDSKGRVCDARALPCEDSSSWEDAWREWLGTEAEASSWAIASVNPPAAQRLARFLDQHGVQDVAWFRSAADVPMRHALVNPETTGADRALAVAAAEQEWPSGTPGLVVLCGTALTVERVAADGTWEGGAIAAGLGLTARALHVLTAQLPMTSPRTAPPAWGTSTLPALEAGIYWGVVGAVRELLARQRAGMDAAPWLVWTGGDSGSLAPAVPWEGPTVVIPDLVLRGLARFLNNPGSLS